MGKVAGPQPSSRLDEGFNRFALPIPLFDLRLQGLEPNEQKSPAMNQIPDLSMGLCVAAGASLGAVFFGGLWWTIQKGLRSTRPAAWFVLSLPLRVGITIGGFYLVSAGEWKRLLACLIGFVLVRALIILKLH